MPYHISARFKVCTNPIVIPILKLHYIMAFLTISKRKCIPLYCICILKPKPPSNQRPTTHITHQLGFTILITHTSRTQHTLLSATSFGYVTLQIFISKHVILQKVFFSLSPSLLDFDWPLHALPDATLTLKQCLFIISTKANIVCVAF